MYEVIIELLNEEKRFTIKELTELKELLEQYKYTGVRVRRENGNDRKIGDTRRDIRQR